MNGVKEMTLRQYNTELKLDLSKAIVKKIEVEAKLEEKRLACGLLTTYSHQDVDIIGIIAQENEKIIGMSVKYIDELTSAHEKALQPQRLFGFKRKEVIRAEARGSAMREGLELHFALSVSNNPVVRSIIAQRQAIKSRFNQHFSNLLEYDYSPNKLEFDKLVKMIPQ